MSIISNYIFQIESIIIRKYKREKTEDSNHLIKKYIKNFSTKYFLKFSSSSFKQENNCSTLLLLLWLSDHSNFNQQKKILVIKFCGIFLKINCFLFFFFFFFFYKQLLYNKKLDCNYIYIYQELKGKFLLFFLKSLNASSELYIYIYMAKRGHP